MENYTFKMCDDVKLVKINKYLENERVKIGDVGVVMLEERNGYLLVAFDGFIYENRHGEWITAVPEITVGVPINYLAPATNQDVIDSAKKIRKKWRETASKEEIEDLDAFDKKHGLNAQ